MHIYIYIYIQSYTYIHTYICTYVSSATRLAEAPRACSTRGSAPGPGTKYIHSSEEAQLRACNDDSICYVYIYIYTYIHTYINTYLFAHRATCADAEKVGKGKPNG